MDCCFSGKWVQALHEWTDATSFADNVAVQASCGPDEMSFDDTEEGGSFTKAYVDFEPMGQSWRTLTPPPFPQQTLPHPAQRPCGMVKWDALWSEHALSCVGGKEMHPSISILHREAFKDRPAHDLHATVGLPSVQQPSRSAASRVDQAGATHAVRAARRAAEAAAHLDARRADFTDKVASRLGAQ